MTELIFTQITRLLNLALKLSPAVYEALAAEREQALAVIVSGTPWRILITLRAQELIISSFDEPDEANCILRAPPATLLKLLLTQDQQLLRQPEVSLQGDLLVMKTFANLSSQLDLDWEEILSKYLGDVAAFATMERARAGKKFFGQTVNSMCDNTRDYLQDELALLAPKILVTDFLNAVTDTSLDCNRLEARLHRLEQRIAS